VDLIAYRNYAKFQAKSETKNMRYLSTIRLTDIVLADKLFLNKGVIFKENV